MVRTGRRASERARSAQANQNYSCSAVNVGMRDVVVEVSVTIVGSAIGSGAVETCSPLAPVEACTAIDQAGGTNYRYCTITTSSKRTVRGTFCNDMTGHASP